MRKHRACALALVAALAVAACGGSGDDAGDPGAAAAAGADGDTRAVAADAGGDLRCPAKVREELAGPDIIGLRLGMTVDEALAAARCALGADAQVKTGDRWLDRLDTHGVELGTQTFTVRKGEHRPCDFRREWQECEGGLKWEHVDETVTVATPGAPGAESAQVIWRNQSFREDAMPPVQALLDALTAKYGQPQLVDSSDAARGYSAGYRDLEWLYDRAGNPLTEANPMFGKCRGAVRAYRGDTRASWTDGCGLNIRARVVLSGKNPGLAMEMGSAMLHQGNLFAHVEAMQQALQRQGQARREAEVQAAGAGDVRL